MTSETGSSGRDARPSITDLLTDGPAPGKRFAARTRENSPPDTVDLPSDDGDACSAGVEEWVESGPAADYTFLYGA
ncbi:MAG TPA: hypothetical protein VFY32_18900 [Solirubrobacteraceae bacterium]|jgi:hypothetical protein|nr:hypothetical protein [Solirubrobacteraceae bacterium]